jgi:hypothetical protein
MKDRVIQFVLSNLPQEDSQRVDALSESIADTLLPSLAETAQISSSELAAKTLIELAYIVGFTHQADHSLAVMAAVSEALHTGMQDYSNENLSGDAPDLDEADITSDYDNASVRIH